MTSRLRYAPYLLVLLALAALVAACIGGASPPPSPSGAGAPLSEAAAKIALFDEFGPLVYCDPDEYPVARADPATAALAHLAAMQGDAIWPLLARRLGFSATVPPTGDQLLAAYGAWKMARALELAASTDGWSFDARFAGAGSEPSKSGTVTHVGGTIGTDGAIHVATEEASGPPPCPICLARGTTIATPAGDVAVEALRPGDPVWTVDRLGRRVAGVVVEVGSIPVPVGHQVVDLVLVDGRVVHVSPRHPLADGRPVGALRTGERFDGSVVASVERVSYLGGRTFDLLPSGPTGIYWANGIELGSTLFH